MSARHGNLLSILITVAVLGAGWWSLPWSSGPGPTSGEVTWTPPDGRAPYFRCTVGLEGSWFPPTELGADPTAGELTLWRRSRGEPDPVILEVLGTADRRVPFPEVPRFEVRVRNVDLEGRDCRLQTDQWGVSDWDLRALPADGRRDWGHRRESRSIKGEVPDEILLIAGKVLEPYDGARPPVLALSRLQMPVQVDPIAFRIQLGSDFEFWTHAHHAGCQVLAESPVVSFTWEPITVQADRHLAARTLEALQAFRGPPTRGNHHLDVFESLGLAAIPTLLDQLESGNPRRRAVVLGALHRITGLLDPEDWPRWEPGPLGSPQRTATGGPGPPSAEAQAWFVEQWRGARELVHVVE